MICDARFNFCDLIMIKYMGVHAKNSPQLKRISSYFFCIKVQNPPKMSSNQKSQGSEDISQRS